MQVAVHARLATNAIVAVLGSALSACAIAQPPDPVFRQNFSELCAEPAAPQLVGWSVSSALPRGLWNSRLTCVSDEGARYAGADGKPAGALRITVQSGDAYETADGQRPTERVELQIRSQIVKFDQPVWYSFGFRLVEPWPRIENRTVIHQVKQNVLSGAEAEAAARCPAANPFFKIEAGHLDAAGGPAFVAEARGTHDCYDGLASVPFCGPWPLASGKWHRIHVALNASQRHGGSSLRIWLDGRPCPTYSGMLGYVTHGRRDADGRPLIEAQPRVGIYRDALSQVAQSIDISDFVLWDARPADHPVWAGIDLPHAR